MDQYAGDQGLEKGFIALSKGRPLDALVAVEGVDPNAFPRVYLLRGHAHKALGQHLQAEESYRALLIASDRRHQATGWWSLASLKTTQFSASDAATIDRLIDDGNDDGYQGLLHLARAEIWHQAGLPEVAFTHLKAGNDLIASVRPFHGEAYHRLIHDLLKVSSWPLGNISQDDAVPLFIIGQPRSGTTLIEQILASHPDVDATDELTFIGHRAADLERDGGYAKSLRVRSDKQWRPLRDKYLKTVAPYREKRGSYFLDKTPENFLHVGLIIKLFPQARIVHVLRDPLDNIVSQYRHFFPESREYSNTLEGLIFYWQGYLNMMRHWSGQFPDHIYNLHYSHLVRSPEASIKALLDFCGLSPCPDCFTPHCNERPVMTPSAAQVRQPINQAGLGSGIAYAGVMRPWLRDIGRLKEVSDKLYGEP